MTKTSKALMAAGILVVLAAAGLLLLFSRLDRIVAAAIEEYGSEATGTKVTVSSVRIRLKAGEGTIRTLSVGNPRGFAGAAFRLDDITVAVDTGTITGNPVVIDKVTVLSPRIAYEIDRAGRSNIAEIRKRVGGYGTREPTAGKTEEKRGKKIVIRRLVVENGEVSVRAAALPGKPTTVAIPRIVLSNLGGKGGDSPAAIARQILEPLLNQAARAAARTGFRRYLGEGTEGMGKTIEENLAAPGGEASKGAEEAVRRLLGK